MKRSTLASLTSDGRLSCSSPSCTSRTSPPASSAPSPPSVMASTTLEWAPPPPPGVFGALEGLLARGRRGGGGLKRSASAAWAPPPSSDELAARPLSSLSVDPPSPLLSCTASSIHAPSSRPQIEPKKRPRRSPTDARGPRYTAADDALILRLRAEGKKLREIARTLGRTAGSLNGHWARMKREMERVAEAEEDEEYGGEDEDEGKGKDAGGGEASPASNGRRSLRYPGTLQSVHDGVISDEEEEGEGSEYESEDEDDDPLPASKSRRRLYSPSEDALILSLRDSSRLPWSAIVEQLGSGTNGRRRTEGSLASRYAKLKGTGVKHA